MAEKKPSEVLGGWNRQVAEQLGQIADNTGGEGTAQAGSEKRPSDVLGGWYKEVSDLLDDIATNTEGGGAEPYVLPTMSPTTKGGATVGEGLTMDGTALSVDYSEVASVDALEDATALSPTGGIVSTQDGLAISPTQQTTGAIDGALLELTAKSKPATQATTTGKNLLDKNNVGLGAIRANGIVDTESPEYCHSDYIPVQELNSYTFSGVNGELNNIKRIHGYSQDKTWIANLANTNTLNARDPYSFTATIPSGVAFVRLSFEYSDTNPQLELGSTATEYEPYTGGAPSPSPDYSQPIVTVRGWNLLNPVAMELGYMLYGSDAIKTTSESNDITEYIEVEAGASYYINSEATTSSARTGFYDKDHNLVSSVVMSTAPRVVSVPYNACFMRATIKKTTVNPYIVKGSIPQPYVPYGHVGLERRDSQGTLLDTTPIPLPSRGWVAGLPDGTADELSVDGAGKVVWTEKVWKNVIDENTSMHDVTFINNQCRAFFDVSPNQRSTSSIPIDTAIMSDYFKASGNTNTYSGSMGIHRRANNSLYEMVLSWGTGYFANESEITAWLSTHPVTVLYPLATPVTEDCGYIDLPDMQDCVLSIPELDALGVRYTIGDGAEIARQWYQRSRSEYEQRITDLEEAVAELTAGA